MSGKLYGNLKHNGRTHNGQYFFKYRFCGDNNRVVYMETPKRMRSEISGTEQKLLDMGFVIIKDYPRGGLFV